MQKIPAHWNLLPIYAGFKNVTENEKVDKLQRLMKVDVIYGSLIKYLPRLTELAYQSLVYNIKTKTIPTVSTYMGFETQKFNVKLPGWWWFADLPTDSLTDINQYCNVMLKYMPENMLATFKKNLLYTREGVVLSVGCNSRAHNNDNDTLEWIQDLMTIKTISSYQPHLLIFKRQKDFRLPFFKVIYEFLF